MLNEQTKSDALVKVGLFLKEFLAADSDHMSEKQQQFAAVLHRAELENRWFTPENTRNALKTWAENLTAEKLDNWLQNYRFAKTPKTVGLILAGNLPLVGLHDVIAVLLSGNRAQIKLSSKDKVILPFLLKLWEEELGRPLDYALVDRLQNFDAVIATGSNNTARYLEYYFREKPSILRKNRTSVAVLTGKETDEQLQRLATDIFRYFGLGCRNVTRLFIPKNFKLDRLFMNFTSYSDVINHHKYANNYDYNRAVFLLNQDLFWDNNFVLLRESNDLFGPLAVINFSRYDSMEEVNTFIAEHSDQIQCVVAGEEVFPDAVSFGESQCPALDTYADNVDTMAFLEVI